MAWPDVPLIDRALLVYPACVPILCHHPIPFAESDDVCRSRYLHTSSFVRL